MKITCFKVLSGGLLIFGSTVAWAAPVTDGAPSPMMNDSIPMAESTGSMKMGRMQGGLPPPDARDPHAYSDGYDFGDAGRPHFADEQRFGSLLANRMEVYEQNGATTAVYDLQLWYGYDYDRLVVKAEGDVTDGKIEEAGTELLWSHAVASFWDMQLGVRHDSGELPDQGWLAFGIQGLAPYWFEVDATAYFGEVSRTAINVELEYELLFTQKLILQPRIEMNWYGKEDLEREIGEGLSDASAGLRLRYEIRREFAPYIGIERFRRYGNTRELVKESGADPDDTRVVAGIRFWF